MTNFSITFDSESAMQRWVRTNAHCLGTGLICYLDGDLGAGKTSFCRALIQALGFDGHVKSPTYTLLEVYEIQSLSVCHFDLYRLGEPEELHYLGLDDYADGHSLWLVEWPERGAGFLPAADVVLEITQQQAPRQYTWVAMTPRGESALACLQF